MNKIFSNITYFKQGYALTNKSWEIYLFSLALSVISVIQLIFSNSPLSPIVSLIYFISLIFNIGFSLSLPVFLKQKQLNKQIKFQEMFALTLKNTKRMILPGIALFSLAIVIFLVLVMVIVVLLKPSENSVFQIGQYLSNPNLILVTFMSLSSVFTFTSFLFSLENKGLFASVKGSLVLSFRNIPFILFIAVIGIISSLIFSALRFDNPLESVLRYAIYSYIGLFTSASTLFYYQKVIKKEG